jgi:putative ABC transport system permease protein
MKNLFKRLFRRRALDAEVREEIQAHIAMRAESNKRAGMPEEEAVRDARLRFGNRVSIREEIYTFNGFAIVDALQRDLRSGFRTLVRHPGVTALALLSLTLGIGANTLAFSFVDALFFRDLPYPNADRLLVPDDPLTPDECRTLRERGREIFENVGCFVDMRPAAASFSADGDGAPAEFVLGHRFTPEMGEVLGIPPRLGRWFMEDESSVVISHRLWQSRFSGRPDVLGKRVRIDSEFFTIAGVMPDEFEFMIFTVDYWAPVRSQERQAHRDSRVLGAVARLAPGATITQAQSLLDSLMSARVATPAEVKARKHVQFVTMRDLMRGQLRDFALLFQGTVLFVLLIACANVAGLLLSEAVSEQGQFAVRSALGSGTWRILREVLVHSILLFSVGGVCGLAAGWAGVRLMINVVLPFAVDAYGEPRGGIPRSVLEAGLDTRVFLFTFSLALLCGLVAAIAPMMQVARSRPLDVLRESTQSVSSGLSRQRLRGVFVSTQIALALLLLVGATLMLKGMRETLNQDVGFEPADLLTVQLRLPDVGAESRSMSAQMRQNLAQIAGISSVSGIAISPPLSGAVTMPIEFDATPSQAERAQFLPILPGYFETLHVKVVQGREFHSGDAIESAPVVVINEAAARRYWPNQNPLGRQIRFSSAQLPAEPLRTVIGIVTEVSQYSGQRSRSQVYVPYSQIQLIGDSQLNSQLRGLTFILRTSRPPFELAAAIDRAIDEVDRSQAVSVRTMQQTMFAATQRRGVIVALFGLFGLIAVVLAVIGVYGVMCNMVSQRLNELGIRIAVGAEPRQIRSLVIRRGGFLIGTGLLAGTLLSLAMTRIIRSFLFGASSTDPLAFGLGIVLLGGAAFVACYVPARRASRIDPVVALRHH